MTRVKKGRIEMDKTNGDVHENGKKKKGTFQIHPSFRRKKDTRRSEKRMKRGVWFEFGVVVDCGGEFSIMSKKQSMG